MISPDMPKVCLVEDYFSEAQSAEGIASQKNFKEISNLKEESLFLGGFRRELCQELDNAVEEALGLIGSDEAIDPISILISHQNAKRFIDLLPLSFSPPEISVEGDGEIAFDWIRSKDYYLSLSIGNSDYCHYAAIIGPNRYHGKELIVDAFPETVIPLIHKIIA